MQPQTPLSISKHIAETCERVSPCHDPVFLDVAPLGSAEVQECFDNVAKQISNHSGSPQYGWNVFEWPRVMLDLEFHCVWKDPEGKLHDITPRHDAESVVLFLPDPTMTYTGQCVDNRRFSLSDDPSVDRYIQLAEEMVAIQNANRPPYGRTAWTVDAKALRPILTEMQTLSSKFKAKPHRNDPCPCLSRKKYKHCCGRE